MTITEIPDDFLKQSLRKLWFKLNPGDTSGDGAVLASALLSILATTDYDSIRPLRSVAHMLVEHTDGAADTLEQLCGNLKTAYKSEEFQADLRRNGDI